MFSSMMDYIHLINIFYVTTVQYAAVITKFLRFICMF